jgi:pimeloyl-ACP methyl ester carboxylesterase
MSSYLLVHGAWHGAWCWEAVQERLPEAIALDLPSNHVEGASFTDDVNAVRDALDGMTDVVLCGHSYGGAVISEAGAHDHVRHLVYLTAFALDVGETVLDNAAAQDPVASAAPPVAMSGALRVEDDGRTVVVDPAAVTAAFYADCDPAPVDRLVPHSMRAFEIQTTAAAWRDRPSTYVVCTQDQAIHPDVQRFFAGRTGGRTVELDASHSPMLSMPDAVAEILRAAAT